LRVDLLCSILGTCGHPQAGVPVHRPASRKGNRPLRQNVLNGLAVFDERNSDGKHDAVHAALQFCAPQDLPVFRVVDEPTRDASGQPVCAGAMIFNLRARRIIQIQNYHDVERKGRVRVLENDRRGPLLPYELPSEWSIVP